MTSPEPFERIPLDWSNAFGGPGNPENSLGKGSNARDLLGRREPAELPNIEAPELLVTGIEDRPAPAGLVPRAADAPSRLRFAGVYDDDWLRDGFPGPGRGFDWRYHNTACPDQQTEAELHGNESFRITSMHPKGVPPKLIIFNGFLVGAGAQHCQGQIRQRDRFATTMTIPTRNGDFGATRAGSKWPAPRAHSTACPNA